MIHPVHHVPGRLRLRVPAVKQSEFHADAIGRALGETQGVLRHAISPRTGSVVVHYAPEHCDPQRLVERLRESVPAAGAAPAVTVNWQPMARGAEPDGALLQRVGQTVATSLVEKLIERSALALVAALL
ncbi:MAG: hypothetical protein IT469_09670 [Pseudomonadales bacterium]|mgnify:CR=1 FL=1|nr:hypothetical protein [Pseudomonadales bacterium]